MDSLSLEVKSMATILAHKSLMDSLELAVDLLKAYVL